MIDRTKCPPINAIEKFELQTPERRILPNGIPLSLFRSDQREGIRMDILINAGIWQQEMPLQALFTNRMLREGAGELTSGMISETFDYYGAWISTNTTLNYNQLSLYSLNKDFDKTLSLLALLLKEPTFPEAEFKVMVDANRQQYMVNSSKVGVMAHKCFNRSLFGSGHPCGHFAKLEDYDLITTGHLRQYYNRYYHSGNCAIMLSGNIDEEMIGLVEQAFGKEAWGNSAQQQPMSPQPVTPTTEKRIFIEHPDSVQSAIRVGTLFIDRTHPDYAKACVLITLFGGYFGSRLMANIREEKGYTYHIAAAIQDYPYHSILSVSTEAGTAYVEETLREIKHEMKRLHEELVSQQELALVQNYMMGEICRSSEGVFSLPDTWIFLDTAGLDETYYTGLVDAIRTITPEEIRQLAVKYLRPEEQIEVIAGKKM
ncbi:MAG: insulinase family protein [Bacteroidaceae bacterium]|nr:insulinase family protein [Bacteroidaceae bacterium]